MERFEGAEAAEEEMWRGPGARRDDAPPGVGDPARDGVLRVGVPGAETTPISSSSLSSECSASAMPLSLAARPSAGLAAGLRTSCKSPDMLWE